MRAACTSTPRRRDSTTSRGIHERARPLPLRSAHPEARSAEGRPLTAHGGTASGRPLAGVGRRPDLRFLVAHPAHVFALGFGSGLARRAPGTFGTAFAWIVWSALLPPLGDLAAAGVLASALAIACWSATVTARHVAQADPSAIVCDEMVAFWAVLWLIGPAGFVAELVAFVLFRFFDAAKPGPVAWADRLCKRRDAAGAIGWVQGCGIVFDDLVAAFLTLLVVAGWRFAAGAVGG